MIVPRLKDKALLTDLHAALENDGNFHLWWLGQSGFILKWGREYALFDPYLSDSLTKKYAGTRTEHVRMTERCVAPDQLGFVRTVFCSHLHTDHFDPQTLTHLTLAANARGHRLTLIVPAGVAAQARSRLDLAGIDYHPIDAGDTAELPPFRVFAIPAAHPTLALDPAGHHTFLGFVVSFGPWAIYHSGDTLWHPGLLPALLKSRPDVALLPINGDDPQRRVAGNLNGTEAAALAKASGTSVTIPHHFDMFEFNTATPEEFQVACYRLRQPCQVLQCGERWSSVGRIPRSWTPC